MESGEYAEAEFCFLRTRSLAPDSLETVLNLGFVLDMQGRSSEALACYETVLAIAPGNAKARYNRAMHMLRTGRLVEGFADYEARFAAMKEADRRVYDQPRWDGSPLDGRSILVYCEQGLGDAIQFCRYLQYIARLGGRVILEVQQPLVTLLSGLDSIERVVVKTEFPTQSDVYIPLLSLPHIFHTTLDTIPDQVPYIMPPDALTKLWKERVKGGSGIVKIGLAWAGKARPYPNRTCPPENLDPLLALPGLQFYSLQVGEQERFPLPQAFSDSIVDLTAMIKDFADTAALILNLDLVITIDTAVAHLAGALGKPVWVLLPNVTDWRWMLERSDSPWYPTARLFRQPCPENWGAVIDEVCQALRQQFISHQHATVVSEKMLGTSFQQALAAIENNDSKTAISDLGNLLLHLPDDPAVWFNLGRAHDLSGRSGEAEHAYRQALLHDPNSPAIWFALGELRLRQKAYPEAEFCLHKAHVLKPESVDILLGLGKALVVQNKTAEAFNCCQKILGIKPDSAEATYNMAFLQLRSGDYRSGFANFEARLNMSTPGADTRLYRQPRWDGSALNGRTILVYGEQGMGDVIQFARYIPMLAERGGKVVFEVDPPLLPLFEGFPGLTELVPKSATPPLTDVYIQTLSLPFLFDTTYETIPDRVPYLVPEETKVANWRQKLAADTNFKVGLVWRGNPDNPRDSSRSCSLATFSPLATLPHITFYSLQVGLGSEEVASAPPGIRLVDFSRDLIDFTDTEALIANLDLVISVDTAVAHLAGAMGKPVWVILPEDLDWRWLQGRSDTPWYPSMRLFCQELQSGWAGVLKQVKDALEQWHSEKHAYSKHGDIEADYEKGTLLKEAGDLEGAERCFRQIVEQYPDLPDPQHSLGVVLQIQGRADEAIEHYKAAIAKDPCFVQALYNLANALVQSGRSHEAFEYVRAVLRYDAAHADAHWLLGMLLLLHGEYLEGWKEYEWRWKAKQFLAKIPDLGRPQWDGAPLEGKTLLIQMEQGRGDMIQFARYASLAAATGGKVIVRALPELLSLLSTADGVSMAVNQNLPLPDFDLYIPALSLPYLLGTTIETIPSQVPYLRPDPHKVEEWSREFPADALLRIGLAWQGSSGNKDNENRSCPLIALQPLFDLEGVVFYTLQIGDGSEQLEKLPATMKVVDLTERIHDFADSAALIENLDLVISVCTSVTHLAGAIGKPVWTLLHFASDWRWHLERSDSPWYPTMRLFRQTVQADWSGVIAGVRKELAEMLADAESYKKRGISMLRTGNIARAEKMFSRVIDLNKSGAEGYCNRGTALHELNRLEEAIDSYKTALQLQPDYMQALFNMGNAYMSLNKPADALTCYERVIELNPDFVAAYLSLGEVGKTLRNFALGRAGFEQAAAIDPDCAEAFQGIGEICQAEELFEDAIVAYQKSLELKPGNTATLNMMGTAYQSIERLSEAEECYRQVLAQIPEKPTVLNNLGVVLNAQGRLEEALTVYRHLLEIYPDYADGHWNLAVALLAMGLYSEGWREFEWRFRKSNPVPSRHFSQPLWDGSELSGKTILLHAEQGFGDTIQFVRYAPLVARRGGNVIIECQIPALKEVLFSLDGVSQVVSAGEPLPYFDCHLPLMSLPLVFDTTLETIPCQIPYLAADPQKMEIWRRRMGATDSFKVGLVWYAKQSQVLNRKRSCPLMFFSPLWSVKGVEFYTLQIGIGTEQMEDFAVSHKIIDLTSDITSFADTAAFIANLDLVVTIDTAVAHLAGALGARTWVVLPYVAEWRWLCQREDSPWYPTMKLFRQPTQNNWPALMDTVAAALRDSVKKGADKRCDTPVHSRLRVGLAWSGRQDNPLNCKRSCPFSALEPLFELKGITFVNLQMDTTEAADTKMINLTAHIRDFEDTAALMAHLDLIISIDTSVAHLAAATGLPTWVLLSHVADWRWSTDGSNHPIWYPGVELFRQADFGAWDGVVQEVAERLSVLAGEPIYKKPLKRPSTGMLLLDERCRLEQLLEDKQQELQSNISSPDANLDVGAALALLGRDKEAAASFHRVLELDPENIAGHLNLAYSLFASGNYAEGWEHLEWRLRRLNPEQMPPWPILDKKTLGSNPAGKSILVHCEQGYGDTILFSRFLPLLAEAGYRVVVSCQPAMTTLVAAIQGVSMVIPHGESLPPCDMQTLLLSLPWLFSVTQESLQVRIPYLMPGKHRLEAWKRMLEEKIPVA